MAFGSLLRKKTQRWRGHGEGEASTQTRRSLPSHILLPFADYWRVPSTTLY